ncbi:MAG: hypothetical protein WKG06_21960 [Segetibacter sp.]
MQPLTKKVKQVDRKPMTLLERLYLPAIFKGMAITFSHMFKKYLPLVILNKNVRLLKFGGDYMY